MRARLLRVGRHLLLLAVLTAAFGVGLALRRLIVWEQYLRLGHSPPFTAESALQYRQTVRLHETGSLPEVDPFIHYPDGIRVREYDTLGAERLLAALLHLTPSAASVTERLRWISAFWFCLGIPLLGLWLWWWRRSVAAAAAAAGFYAVSLAALIRSTGLELSHENVALPFLIGHLAVEALGEAQARRTLRWLAWSVSGVLLAFAMLSWDLIQYYILLRALWAALRVFRNRPDRPVEGAGGEGLWLPTLMVVGLFDPYLRSHGFLFSPALLLAYGVVLAHCAQRRLPSTLSGWRRPAILAVILFAPLAVGWGGGGYPASYGHFVELLGAKIRFFNRKPADPARLATFDQRILWVPSLQSATFRLTAMLFPAMLVLTLGSMIALVRRRTRPDRDPKFGRLLFFFAASCGTFFFFVRFHVFVAVFAAALLGVWAAWSARKTWPVRMGVSVALLAGVLIEAGWTAGFIFQEGHLMRVPGRWGRANVYYPELEELVQWLDHHVAPDPVLANFGVSGAVLAYGGCPILLYPKFETPAARRRVQAYGEALFKGDGRQFRNWADAHGARYYVHSMGELSSYGVDQQMRYFVCALQPAPDAAVRGFESQSPDGGRYFRLLFGNRKYRVFRILSRADEARAMRHVQHAEERLQRGRLSAAEKQAQAALAIDPLQDRALDVIRHVVALKEKGFPDRSEADDESEGADSGSESEP